MNGFEKGAWLRSTEELVFWVARALSAADFWLAQRFKCCDRSSIFCLGFKATEASSQVFQQSAQPCGLVFERNDRAAVTAEGRYFL
jgi:hypothetical protein